ncbi:MAG TPA: hypothetical protein VGR35_09605 [Tepidisphaeraceae bacterium]|nr:hypothetical protein [Tepidisphaeraceae bacterium]
MDEEIRLSGTNEELLQRIGQAHDRGTITDGDLFDLLARCEENGRQHIFFYRPKSIEVAEACGNVDRIERALLGGKTAAEAGLPITLLEPHGSVVAAFRHEKREGTRYWRWTFKVYSGIQRTKFVRNMELEGDEFAKVYRHYYAREIILVIYHSFGLLEIRRSIFTDMSLTACREELERAWKLVGSAIKREDFEPLVLANALKNLAESAVAGSNLHEVHNAELADEKEGRVMFNPKKHDENLAASQSRCEAIRALQGDWITAVVTWKRPSARRDLPEKLRSEIACFLPHEIRIGSQTTPEAVEYVTRQLYDLS